MFASSITGLTAGTTYYARAYAMNSIGTAYGNQVSFTTPAAIAATLTTVATSSITSTTAISGGNVTNDGGATVTARGVCWSTSEGPTIADSKTSDGGGTGTFSSSLTALASATKYHVRAYATNSVGTAYGNEVDFTSMALLPTVTTIGASAITTTTATTGGNVTIDGGAAVTARGICWSTSHNPTIDGSKTIEASGLGSFASSLTGLTINTVYYARAYATNNVGTAYGNEVFFATRGQSGTVSDVNGNSYPTIVIGTQTWMAANLKTTSYRNGNAIPTTSPATQDVSSGTPKYQWSYAGNDGNVATYGRLYTWYAVVDSRGVCPTGWSIPTYDEWTTLSDYLGGLDAAGGKLKETGTAHWTTPNTKATNETGFTGGPGGYRGMYGPFNNIGSGGFWWGTEYDETRAWYGYLSYDNGGFDVSPNGYKSRALSVRCIKTTR